MPDPKAAEDCRTPDRYRAKASRFRFMVAISDSGVVAASEPGSSGRKSAPSQSRRNPSRLTAPTVTHIAVEADYSLFLKSDGSLWGMGDNTHGELGNGSSSSLIPEKLAVRLWLRGACFVGGTYCLVSSTNSALPISQWMPVWTNTIVLRGPNNFSAPLPDDLLSHDPQRFYILQSQ